MKLFPILHHLFTKHTNTKKILSEATMQKLHIHQWEQSSKNHKVFLSILTPLGAGAP